MDLLDSIRQEAGDPAEAHPSGLLKPEGRETPSLLLARMPSSLRPAKTDKLVSFFGAGQPFDFDPLQTFRSRHSLRLWLDSGMARQ